MDPLLVKSLQDEYRKRHPAVTFGKFLGEGAFSATFEASVGRIPCAVKFSKRSSVEDPAVERERQTLWNSLSQLNGHPHIASLHALEEIDDYLVTQWERGEMNLEQRLQECLDRGWAGIPREELLPYMRQAAEAISFFNALNLNHRDIKPENLLLFRRQVKVIDFGFARISESWSAPNSVLGTPEYSPLEVWDGSQPATFIDIFCLAGTFIRLATGEHPFGRHESAVDRKRRGEFHRDGLLPHEVAALSIALHPNAAERTYATASDFVEALAPPAATRSGRLVSTPADVGQPPSKPTLRLRISTLWRAFRELLEHINNSPNAIAGAGDQARIADSIDSPVTREIRAIIDQEEQRAQAASRQVAELRGKLEDLLAKQLRTKQYPWAGGTLSALLRLAPGRDDFRELDRFLDELAPGTGHPRRCDSIGQRFSLILPGEFRMGAPLLFGAETERPIHLVRHTQPYYMSCHPVTVAQFNCCRDRLPANSTAWRNPGFTQAADHPVVNVSYDDALVFCEFKSQLTGLPHALPTEAQWEFACRTGLPAALDQGADEQMLARLGHFNATATTAVGRFASNANGIYDMLGNCHEWCADFYSPDYYAQSPVEDPPGPQPGIWAMIRLGAHRELRVARGGCFDQWAHPTSRAAFRRHMPNPRVGFRVVCPVSLE